MNTVATVIMFALLYTQRITIPPNLKNSRREKFAFSEYEQ